MQLYKIVDNSRHSSYAAQRPVRAADDNEHAERVDQARIDYRLLHPDLQSGEQYDEGGKGDPGPLPRSPVQRGRCSIPTIRVGRRHRSGRGSMLIPPLPETETIPGDVAEAPVHQISA